MNKIKPIIGKLIYASIITILLIFIVTLYFQKMEIRGSLIVCKSLPNIELKNRLNYSNGWFSGYASGFVLLDNEKDRPQDMNQYYIIEALNKKDEKSKQLFSIEEIIAFTYVPPQSIGKEELKIVDEAFYAIALQDNYGNLYFIDKKSLQITVRDKNGDAATLITDNSKYREYMWDYLQKIY
jgi:hypothetical protein